ncbi:MerR family transcriptional regulator [Lentzea sp. NBRC 105346]|uniref:MerR family transcriptional regulator n=1 Tax=Lentzea sp. NBRC 105346 TaxID=3032205 RepID=UPI0024A55FA5|nr:MerR family transcriptional regulator [Lentzea sp. NBRC 105346]GLZ34683.1 MerR family transcriptional regulator [Lentzea sp. NBRC 105346]
MLAELRPEFPEVTISKIRFLESEGLVHPARTSSGYRQFTYADVERLRYVLAAQRDRYLPLKVIREQLSAARPTELSHENLLAQSAIAPELLAQLEQDGLVRPGENGGYCVDDLIAIRTIRTMMELGVEADQLRAFRAAADREAALLRSLSDPGTIREMSRLSATLHSLLVKACLRNALGS